MEKVRESSRRLENVRRSREGGESPGKLERKWEKVLDKEEHVGGKGRRE